MSSFFAELKAAREARGVSLDEIADATLINIKMLEALENGNVDVVPQAYIRAFIREYASVVGLDPAQTMKQYDEWLASRDHPAPLSLDEIPEPPQEETTPESPREKAERLVPAFFRIVAAIVVLVLVDVMLWSVLEKEPASPVKETSFRDVVRENELRAGLLDTSAAAGRTPPRSPKDSLTLTAVTTDSVWLQVLVDSTLHEHFLYPRRTFTWKARNDFLLVAVGNPAAIKFTLNSKQLAIPYTRGVVARNIRVGRDSLR